MYGGSISNALSSALGGRMGGGFVGSRGSELGGVGNALGAGGQSPLDNGALCVMPQGMAAGMLQGLAQPSRQSSGWNHAMASTLGSYGGMVSGGELLPSLGFPACLVAALQHVTSSSEQHAKALMPDAASVATFNGGFGGSREGDVLSLSGHDTPTFGIATELRCGGIDHGMNPAQLSTPGVANHAAAAISAAVERAYSHMSGSLSNSIASVMGGGVASVPLSMTIPPETPAYNGSLLQRPINCLEAPATVCAAPGSITSSQTLASTDSEADAFHRAAALLGGGLGGSFGSMGSGMQRTE